VSSLEAIQTDNYNHSDRYTLLIANSNKAIILIMIVVRSGAASASSVRRQRQGAVGRLASINININHIRHAQQSD